MAGRDIVIADGHHRYETALAYRDERRVRDGDPGDDRPYDFILMHLVNLQGEGLVIYPTHRVVMGRREVTDEVLHAFDVSEIDAPPAQVEEALGLVPADTVAFAVWRGAGRPALLCKLRDRAAVSMAMSGAPAPVRKIDSAVLEAVVLAPLLGLLDPGPVRHHRQHPLRPRAGRGHRAGRPGRRVGRVPAARADRRPGARGRRRRRRHAAEVDLLLPQAALRLPDQSAGRVMRARLARLLPPRVGGRRGRARRHADPRRPRAGRRPRRGRRRHDGDGRARRAGGRRPARGAARRRDRLPARVRGAGRAHVRRGRAVGGRGRPDRRLAEREAAAALLLPLDRLRRRADDRRRPLRLRARLRQRRGVGRAGAARARP